MLERLPMSICHEQLEVRTKGKGLYEITDDVQAKIDRCGVRNGILTVLFNIPVAAFSSWKTPIRPPAAIWRSFSIAWFPRMPITLLTVPKAAMICRHTSGWR